MTRAIVVTGRDEQDIATALGYPTPCYNAATGEVVPGVYSLRHRDAERDDQGRSVLVVDDVEAALPAPLRARVVSATRAVVADVVAPDAPEEAPAVVDPRTPRVP